MNMPRGVSMGMSFSAAGILIEGAQCGLGGEEPVEETYVLAPFMCL